MSSYSSLFAHMAWADQRSLDALRAMQDPDARAVQLLAHVLGAEQVWMARMIGAEAPSVWPELDVAGCARLANEVHAHYQRMVAGLDERELARVVHYRNSAGKEFDSTVEDILLHVVMHGMYHRGQIALLTRAAGGVPNPVDYIAFRRGSPAATRK